MRRVLDWLAVLADLCVSAAWVAALLALRHLLLTLTLAIQSHTTGVP